MSGRIDVIMNYVWDSSPEQLRDMLNAKYPDTIWKGKVLKGDLIISLNDPCRKSMAQQMNNPERYWEIQKSLNIAQNQTRKYLTNYRNINNRFKN